MMRPLVTGFTYALVAIGFAHATALAQEAWPSRPIRFVVPSTPGSTSDLAARTIGQQVGQALGQPIVIENRPGAMGRIAMQQVTTSKSDGYTFVVVSASTTVVPSAVIQSIPYDVLRDFAPVSLIANTRLMMIVAKDSPVNSVAEFVAVAKAQPGQYTYGQSASLYLLSMERFKQVAGIDITAIPYKGPAEATTDLVGGHLSIVPDSLGSVSGMLQSGRVKALAMFSATRLSSLPDVPTMVELGYKDFVFDGWIGVLALAGTPAPVVRRLAREIAIAVASEETRQRYTLLTLDPASSTPEQFASMLASETARYEQIAHDAGIQKQ
jgi:tripartite-type tricarboxylate transporter receptor subunit TctC